MKILRLPIYIKDVEEIEDEDHHRLIHGDVPEPKEKYFPAEMCILLDGWRFVPRTHHKRKNESVLEIFTNEGYYTAQYHLRLTLDELLKKLQWEI